MPGDDSFSIETPENVEVHFDLAGPGSRFCAAALDVLVIAGLTMGIIAVLAVMEILTLGSGLPRLASQLGIAVGILLSFLLFTGYFLLCELFQGGQTPGKKALRIRAIRDDGTPLRPGNVLVRNLLRIVDFLPFLYGLGGILCLLDRRHRRLGDLAAGTVVVKEGEIDYRSRTDRRYRMTAPEGTRQNAELTSEERRLIGGFLHRREELLIAARGELAGRLALPLYKKYGGSFGSAESYLERLFQGRQHEP